MIKNCPGKFYNFVERFKNLLKTYKNYDETLSFQNCIMELGEKIPPRLSKLENGTPYVAFGVEFIHCTLHEMDNVNV